MRVKLLRARPLPLRSVVYAVFHLLVLLAVGAAIWFFTYVPAVSQSGAVTCEPAVYDTCTETGTSVVGGIPLGTHCVREIGRRNCVDTAPLNECAATEVSLNCEVQSEECVDWRHGECRQTRFIYECLNEDADMSPAHLIDTRFGPVQESIENQCEGHEDRAVTEECTFDRTETIEGAEVRDINRRPFAREWWRQRRTYLCVSDSETDNTCGPLESDPTCLAQSNTCLAEDADGNCTHREFHYRCGEPAEDLATSCEPINVCVGDTCLDVHQEENTSFGHSAAWLNVLAEMQDDFSSNPTNDPNEVEFFRGDRRTCSQAPLRDCCDLSGVLTGLFLCPESAEFLAEKRNAGHTHYVGTSCSFRVLGKCIKRRQHYCTYNSKFSRVFMEQFKIHMPEPWGHTHGADCSGISIEDVANVDVDAMDFSEVVGDIADNLTIVVSDEIADFFDDRWPTADEMAQDAFDAVGEQ